IKWTHASLVGIRPVPGRNDDGTLASRGVAAMSLKLRTGALALSWVAVGSVEARADRFQEAQVPRTLRDWIPWAIDGAEERLCPVVGSSATCLWPGRLRLTVDQRGG